MLSTSPPIDLHSIRRTYLFWYLENYIDECVSSHQHSNHLFGKVQADCILLEYMIRQKTSSLFAREVSFTAFISLYLPFLCIVYADSSIKFESFCLNTLMTIFRPKLCSSIDGCIAKNSVSMYFHIEDSRSMVMNGHWQKQIYSKHIFCLSFSISFTQTTWESLVFIPSFIRLMGSDISHLAFLFYIWPSFSYDHTGRKGSL